MTKKIGILGGISHESTLAYYKLIHSKYYEQCRNYHYPEVVIYSLNFQKFTDYEDSQDMLGYVDYILAGITSLTKAGADFIAMAANSPHHVYKEIIGLSKVPLISIAEATAKAAQRQGFSKLLLLGIKFTMQSSFYQDVCREYNMEIIVPSETEQERINHIIFAELARGIFEEKSKAELLYIVNSYDVEGVILGCTELPLIIKAEDTDMMVLNTLELHVDAILTFALDDY